MLLKERIARELARIAEMNNGVLRQEDVVDFARDPDTALHTQFEWDDTEAARKWRLEQAARIIRLQVRVVENTEQTVRAFVSLSVDRTPHGGYRPINAVLGSKELSRQLMRDALAELSAVRRKYQTLKQLNDVWEKLDAVIAAESEEPTHVAV